MSVDLIVLDRHVRVTAENDGDGVIEAAVTASWSRCLYTGVSTSADMEFLVAVSDDAFVDTIDERRVRIHSTTLPDLLSVLTSWLTLRGIESLAGSHVMLHAAGLADDGGRVTALVAASGSGKTTASVSLGRSLGYVTDETVAIAADGSVIPFPKPLSIITGAPGQPKTQVSPDALELLRPVESRLTLGRVLLIDRLTEPVHPSISAVPVSVALYELAGQLSYLWSLERPLDRLLSLLSSVGGVERVTYSDSDSVADVLSAPRVGPSEFTWTDPVPAFAPEGSGPKVVRRPPQDAVQIDDEVAVLVDKRLTILSPLGSLLWRASAEPVAIDALERLATDTFGPVANSDQIVADALRSLADGQILEFVD